MPNKLKAFYSNLRIKHKMFLLIPFVLLAFSLGGWSVMKYAFNVYNEEIYRQSAQALGVTSNGIENELKKMEKLSFRVATDPAIQLFLLHIKESPIQSFFTREFTKRTDAGNWRIRKACPFFTDVGFAGKGACGRKSYY
jgi:hypothetical protein